MSDSPSAWMCSPCSVIASACIESPPIVTAKRLDNTAQGKRSATLGRRRGGPPVFTVKRLDNPTDTATGLDNAAFTAKRLDSTAQGRVLAHPGGTSCPAGIYPEGVAQHSPG